MRLLVWLTISVCGLATPAFADYQCSSAQGGRDQSRSVAFVLLTDQGVLKQAVLRWIPKIKQQGSDAPIFNLEYDVKDGKFEGAQLSAVNVAQAFSGNQPQRMFVSLQIDAAPKPVVAEWRDFAYIAGRVVNLEMEGKIGVQSGSTRLKRDGGELSALYDTIASTRPSTIRVSLIGLDGKMKTTGLFDLAGGPESSGAAKAVSDAAAMVPNYLRACAKIFQPPDYTK